MQALASVSPPPAQGQGLSVMDASTRWYSGAFLLETVPIVLYILMKHGHDFKQAVTRAGPTTTEIINQAVDCQ